MRRFSSRLTRSAETARPAGIPSSTATSPRPCDSPAVVKRNVTLSAKPPITREPDLPSGSHLCRTCLARNPSRAVAYPVEPRGRGVRVREDGQPHHHEPARRDAEQELVPQCVARHPQRSDDGIAYG